MPDNNLPSNQNILVRMVNSAKTRIRRTINEKNLMQIPKLRTER